MKAVSWSIRFSNGFSDSAAGRRTEAGHQRWSVATVACDRTAALGAAPLGAPRGAERTETKVPYASRVASRRRFGASRDPVRTSRRTPPAPSSGKENSHHLKRITSYTHGRLNSHISRGRGLARVLRSKHSRSDRTRECSPVLAGWRPRTRGLASDRPRPRASHVTTRRRRRPPGASHSSRAPPGCPLRAAVSRGQSTHWG